MLGTGRLLTFSFRALVLLLLVPLAWITVAHKYNEALVALAQPLLPGDLSLRALDTHISIERTAGAAPVSIDGFTLHYGLILLTVLVLAAVGIGVLQRIGWLVGFGIGVYILHVVGVVLLARGVAWAAEGGPGAGSDTMVFSVFAVFWGLLPPLIGGAWAFLYWLPRVSAEAVEAPSPGRRRFRALERLVGHGPDDEEEPAAADQGQPPGTPGLQ